jgi:hypothetical protein
MEPYASREIRFWGVRKVERWALKLYSVLFGRGPIEWERFEPGLQLAGRALPEPNESNGRPGLGFLIAHQGRTSDYMVLCWWDRENELPIRVWVRRIGEIWRPAAPDESVCVWDLEIIWSERQAWVSTVLSATGPDLAGYLAAATHERSAP